jgi:hypothetical protein
MISRILFALTTLLLCVMPVAAAPLKIYVAEFKVTGAAGKDELKGALQSMLASRLAGETVQVVGVNDAPDMTVIGTYIVFGKVFSLDGQLVGSNGKTVGRAFEQGDAADDVIPAVGRLAQKLRGEIDKVPVAVHDSRAPIARVTEPPSIPAVRAVPPVSADIVRREPAEVAKKDEDIIRPERSGKNGESVQRLDGVMMGLVSVKRSDNASREIVVALEKELRYYRQDKDIKLAATETGFDNTEKIIAIDGADLDGDGIQEFYVTAFKGEQLSSRVYQLENGRFKKIAADLPYFFRGIALNGTEHRIYAQEMGLSDDFYGDMFEVVKKGSSFQLANPIKLPPLGNLYNVNRFSDKDGKPYFLIIHPDGYLLVYDDKGENIWKSSDKFGGSETYFTRDDMQNIRVTSSQFRKRFIEQRTVVTKNGIVIVPRNEGSFVIGNSRSFNKNSVYAFAWNGAGLEELWHTKVHQNYLSDYAYDDGLKELVMLEVVKKAGMVEKGASAVVVRSVE